MWLDWEILTYGVLVVCAIIALIITIKPRKQPPFPEWFKEVEKLFLKNGFSLGYLEGLNKRDWEEAHREGLSPIEAYFEYFE